MKYANNGIRYLNNLMFTNKIMHNCVLEQKED